MIALGCASKAGRRAGEEPEDHKRNKEVQEIVGNEGLAGGVQEETIAVSDTIR